MARWIARVSLIVVAVLLAVALRPLARWGAPWDAPLPHALVGLAFAGLAFAAEAGARAASLWRALGAIAGLLVGGVTGAVLSRLLPDGAAGTAGLGPLLYLAAVYFGGTIGARVAAILEGSGVSGRLARSEPPPSAYKIVDTSVIIDGRLADVCDTGFLDGVLVVPGFVLRELQYVADAVDPQRRARGRRGLETLQKLKKCPAVRVTFAEDEIPEVREVDLKLLELARRMGGKLLTNDYNLNRVASIRGVEVLNLNDLANSLKPVVLPGESMRVAILREGKEAHQGVAYLDDGTLVVVEQARGLVGKTVDVTVTSVLQTTAGKMFFGKLATTADAAPVPAGAGRGVADERPGEGA